MEVQPWMIIYGGLSLALGYMTYAVLRYNKRHQKPHHDHKHPQ